MKFWRNPLLVKELREEMRSRKIFFLVPVYVAILSIVSIIAVANVSGVSFNPLMLASTSHATMFSFIVTISILLGLVAVILGASSFTTEKERATFELLELTPLSYTQLVLGKFFHCLLIILLILLSSLPVLSTLFFMGGLTYSDILFSFYYVVLFLAVVTLGAICISAVSSRTIVSIISALGLAFVVAAGMGILTATSLNDPSELGFACISPWLVSWQQIFTRIPFHIGHRMLPVWPFYSAFYILSGLVLLNWARNALDTRKLERNSRSRLLGLLCLNIYIAGGLLCMRVSATFTATQLDDFYQVIMFAVLIVLPFFALGSFSDKEFQRFRERPLIESFHPRLLFLNHPATGIFFLLFLLLTLTVNVHFSTGASMLVLKGYLALLALWIVPWFFVFSGLRILGGRPRTIFLTYLLGSLFYTLFATFGTSSRTVNGVFDFYFTAPVILVLCITSVVFYSFARIYSRKKVQNAFAKA